MSDDEGEIVDGDEEEDVIDITPEPRILSMLGEIHFAPWQCLSEFIDNSIDAYLTAIADDENYLDNSGMDVFGINVDLPAQADFDNGLARLSVTDMGPGMTRGQLQRAVKAGFSGNDPMGKLGLFGMGFNISTARLGRRTKVMTTRAGDPTWLVVEIDLDKLEERGEFKAPVTYIEKEDDNFHGTIVEVSRLKKDFKGQLSTGSGRLAIRKKLRRIYSSILNDHPVVIKMADSEVLPWKHCVWSEERTVTLGGGSNTTDQSPIVEIDYSLPDNKFCNTCWHWLEPSSVKDDTCHMCGTVGNLELRPRRIHGWLGIQRYFHKEHYGIDFIRNGRVIEELNKDCFYWTNPEGVEEKEYPIDTTHWGGRIVGQINIDFGKVFYQKDKFDKNRKSWKEVVDYLRGSSPLRPKICKEHDLPENASPMQLLFKAFRSGSKPGRRMLVPGQSGRPDRGDNADAEAWADRFYNGEEEFQADTLWWDRVMRAERAAREDDDTAGSDGGDGGGGDAGSNDDGIDPSDPFGDDEEDDVEDEHTVYLVPDTDLSRTYNFPDTRNAPRAIEVDVYIDTRELRRRDLEGLPPLKIDTSQAPSKYRMEYHAKHPAFTEFAEMPADYVLLEVASWFSTRQGGGEWTVGKVYQGLKNEYQRSRKLDLTTLGHESTQILGELKEHLGSMEIGMDRDDAPDDLIRELTADVMGTSGNMDDVDRYLRNGSWIERVSEEHLIVIIRESPELVMDGRFFEISFESIPEEMKQIRNDTVERVVSCLRDAILIKNAASRQSPPDKSLLLRADAAISYLRERRE